MHKYLGRPTQPPRSMAHRHVTRPTFNRKAVRVRIQQPHSPFLQPLSKKNNKQSTTQSHTSQSSTTIRKVNPTARMGGTHLTPKIFIRLHITSHHITSYITQHITSHHIIHHSTSHHIISYITSHHIIHHAPQAPPWGTTHPPSTAATPSPGATGRGAAHAGPIGVIR